MSIEVKTLRIGSHVSVDGRRVKITGLDPKACLGSYRIATTDKYGIPTEYIMDTLDDVEPIPLTPALLEELGFEHRDNAYWERWFKGGFNIEKKEESHYFDYNGEIRLEYLHELESLYYMIYEKELIPD